VKVGYSCLTLGNFCSLEIKLCTNSERRYFKRKKKILPLLYTALKLRGGAVSQFITHERVLLKGLGTHGMEKTTLYFSTGHSFYELSAQNSLWSGDGKFSLHTEVKMAYKQSNSTSTKRALH